MVDSSSTPFADLLTVLAHWLLVASLGWLVLLGAAALIETITAGRLRAMSWVGCPPVLRQALLAGLGAVLANAPGSMAATPSREPAGPAGLLATPARPLGPPPTSRLLVRPGDTLWQLSAERMSARASAAEVCLAVQRLHHRNRGVIGPDPDLLLPGQRLVVPPRPGR